MTQYLHKSWTEEEGIALPAINALAQTADGYLWLGTGTGLIRFDGMRFVHWAPPEGTQFPDDDVRSLVASADGSLWIRTAKTISRLDRGRLVRYPEVDRWLGGRNRAISVDASGRLYLLRAANPPEIGAILPDGGFRVFSQADGLPAQRILNIFEPNSTGLWIATDDELCQWRPKHPAECHASPWGGVLSISGHGAADWLIADASGKSVLGTPGNAVKSNSAGITNVSLLPKLLMLDHDGCIWLGTVGQGLIRATDGKLERFTRLKGLSSDYIRGILED
ncbi:MAG TPA: two-component regulator propeller domain-containing protein, partial [Bryobacteraceae bacterium]